MENTPAIERANRLMSLKAMPGYLELIRISQRLVEEATAQLVDFNGWDEKQIAVLKARAQAAKEHHSLLFSLIDQYIQDGYNEAQSQQQRAGLPSDESARAVIEEADRLRASVLAAGLETGQIQDDERIAGSYAYR